MDTTSRRNSTCHRLLTRGRHPIQPSPRTTVRVSSDQVNTMKTAASAGYALITARARRARRAIFPARLPLSYRRAAPRTRVKFMSTPND
ncbi:MAG: hypothetical protein ACRDNO_26105, partial [Trebonia sp.]